MKNIINPHPSLISIFNRFKCWKQLRKYFKQFGISRSEQKEIMFFLDIYERMKNKFDNKRK